MRITAGQMKDMHSWLPNQDLRFSYCQWKKVSLIFALGVLFISKMRYFLFQFNAPQIKQHVLEKQFVRARAPNVLPKTSEERLRDYFRLKTVSSVNLRIVYIQCVLSSYIEPKFTGYLITNG